MAQITPAKIDPNDIIEDDKSRQIKTVVMNRLKPNTWLNSVSKVTTFIGGPLFAAGLTMAATQFFGVGAHAFAGAAAAHAVAGAAAVAGLSAITLPTIGILAVGALFVGAAVATDFMASRIWQGCNFDNLEANADSTARHMVKELKASNMGPTELANASIAQRSDWADRVSSGNTQKIAGAPDINADWAKKVTGSENLVPTTAGRGA